MSETVKLKLVRSLAGQKPGNIKIVRALGFSRMQQVLVKPKNPSIMGMVKKVGFMLEILP
jgi:large subunit ribosomal protein L30